MKNTKISLLPSAEQIEAAARILIGIARSAERRVKARSEKAEFDLEIGLTGGGVETWRITVERTASSH